MQTLGDANAFIELVKIHQSKIRLFLLRLCKNYDDADDLAQETFLTGYQKIPSFQGRGSFSSWLFKIAYNCFQQHQRRLNRRRDITQEFVQQSQTLQEKQEYLTVEQLDFERMIAKLNTGERAALTLYSSYGLSHSEIAELLDMPLGSVKSNIGRGREKLQKMVLETTKEYSHE